LVLPPRQSAGPCNGEENQERGTKAFNTKKLSVIKTNKRLTKRATTTNRKGIEKNDGGKLFVAGGKREEVGGKGRRREEE